VTIENEFVQGRVPKMEECDVARLVKVRRQDENTTIELTILNGESQVSLSLSQARTLAYDMLGIAERGELRQRLGLSKG
jgi:hypothetical protein